MKRFFAVLAFAVCMPLASHGEKTFEELDSAMTRAVAARAQAEKEKSAWQAEKLQLQEAIKAYEARLDALRESAEKRRAENEAMRKNLDVISDKISRDEEFLEKLSAFLDLKYSQILSNDSARDMLEKENALPVNFEGKTVMEKFRSLAAMLSTLRIKDGELSTEHGAVSTGAFVTARSSGKKAVKTFYVERGKEPADE